MAPNHSFFHGQVLTKKGPLHTFDKENYFFVALCAIEYLRKEYFFVQRESASELLIETSKVLFKQNQIELIP
jgi:hypothetical protein